MPDWQKLLEYDCVTGLSIVVPTFDEADGIVAGLRALAPLRSAGHEVIVVDGGSQDRTEALARPYADLVLRCEKCRAVQQNVGAAAARHHCLLFLHADTVLPADAVRSIHSALYAGKCWGRFDVEIEGAHPLLKVVSSLMNLRSRATGVATGDQAIFATREAFFAVGGFPEIPLMEDVALSKQLRRRSAPASLAERVRTSGRRWESDGVLRTILLMWKLRLLYFVGCSPHVLAKQYRDARRG